MGRERSLQALFEVIVDSAARICAAQRCSLMLREAGGDLLRIRAARGIPPEVIEQVRVNVGEGIAGSVVAGGEPLYIANVEADRRFARRNGQQYRDTSLVCVPIRVGDRVEGVLNVSNKAGGASFSTNDLNVMTLLASQAAVAIDNAERYQDLSRQAITDGLTGLYLRRYFDDCLALAWRSAQASGKGFALLMADIDHFKRVNDEHGHPAGDAVLRIVAQRVRQAVRDEDLAARYGGEEFAIILARGEAGIARTVAERLRRGMEREPITVEGLSLTITFSIGLAVYDAGYATAEDLLKASDDALYVAKQGGRNRVEVAPPPAAEQ
jgi:diguanylate cyclase (GGDEF)-like protein